MAYGSLRTASGLTVVGDNVGTLGSLEAVKIDIGAAGATSGPVGLSNPLPVRRAGAAVIQDATVSWSNSAAANSENTVDLDLSSAALSPNGGLIVIVRNPSTETALAGELRVAYSDGATTRYAKLAPFTVSTNNAVGGTSADGEAFAFDGALLATQRISLKNSTALDSSGGFTARVQAWVF